MSEETFIDDLAQELASVWYDARYWGVDYFTETMTEEVSQEQHDYRYKVFEVSMYHVAQTLVLGGLDKTTRDKLISYLQSQKG